MNVKYCGPALDYSGYGEANRHDIGALTVAGIKVIGEYTKHCLEISDFGDLGALTRLCSTRTDDYLIKILHTTPNIYGRFIEPGKYHIARVFWETDKLPDDFTRGVRMCQEIWTGSEFNANAIRKAGITNIPIYIIPEAIVTPAPAVEPFIIPNDTDYRFYSIFEWTERKNPVALLESFWKEFENDDNVSLTLKVYVDNFTPEKRKEIKERFLRVKSKLSLNHYAPVYIYTHLLNRSEIYRFHKSFNCYVSAHRGEGWGIPQMEALLTGNPVISTDCGGIHEYLGDTGDGTAALLVPYKMIPVTNVDRNDLWYQSDQKWADVDITVLREKMRFCYNNQIQAKEIGLRGQEIVNDKFNLKTVGEQMKARLTNILQ